MKRAVEATKRGANATEAAVEAGFSDGAHLSRTFKATFGLSPSRVLPFIEIAGSIWSPNGDRNVQAGAGADT
jgi:AraC-like DNA-binding protein